MPDITLNKSRGIRIRNFRLILKEPPHENNLLLKLIAFLSFFIAISLLLWLLYKFLIKKSPEKFIGQRDKSRETEVVNLDQIVVSEMKNDELESIDFIKAIDMELQHWLKSHGSFSIDSSQNLGATVKEMNDKIIVLAHKFYSFILDETPIKISKENEFKQTLTKYQSFLEYSENLGERLDPHKFIPNISRNCKEICKKILEDLEKKDINEIRKEIKEDPKLNLFMKYGFKFIEKTTNE